MMKQPFTEQSPQTSGIPHPQKDLCVIYEGTTTTTTLEGRQEEAEEVKDHPKEAEEEEEHRRRAMVDRYSRLTPSPRNSWEMPPLYSPEIEARRNNS